jgi:glycosylphosphatidylinositol deacylase
MGGIVATSLLPSTNISAIVTMSTPHTLPPARFDPRMDRIYETNRQILLSDPTPIISLCGGATDMMIASESCILPELEPQTEIYRRTVFTSALEGAWTGVGHREMVWCHQVRWRVARAALELGAADSFAGSGLILDTWMRDGHILPPPVSANGFSLADGRAYKVLPADTRLVLKHPHQSLTHLLPIPRSSTSAKFLLFLSQGSIPPVSPHNPLPLQASIHLCHGTDVRHSICTPLHPETLKLIPNPTAMETFPVPDEGSDESEGVVLFKADIPSLDKLENRWIGVAIEDVDGRGWVVGGIDPGVEVRSDAGVLGICFCESTNIYKN